MKPVHIDETWKRKSFNAWIIEISNFVPSCFGRKMQYGLDNFSDVKATGYRLFALYTGIVILDNRLVEKKVYEFFLHLFIAIRILVQDDQEVQMPFVRENLIKFVEKSVQYSGKDFCFTMCIRLFIFPMIT